MDIKKDGPKKDSGTPAMDALLDSRSLMEKAKQRLKESHPNVTAPKDSSSNSTENPNDESKISTPSPFSTTPKLNPY